MATNGSDGNAAVDKAPFELHAISCNQPVQSASCESDAELFHGRFLRSANLLLQNSASLRNALRIRNGWNT